MQYPPAAACPAGSRSTSRLPDTRRAGTGPAGSPASGAPAATCRPRAPPRSPPGPAALGEGGAGRGRAGRGGAVSAGSVRREGCPAGSSIATLSIVYEPCPFLGIACPPALQQPATCAHPVPGASPQRPAGRRSCISRREEKCRQALPKSGALPGDMGRAAASAGRSASSGAGGQLAAAEVE